MKTRIFVVRLNAIEPLGVSVAEAHAQLIKSLNEKGVEVLAEIPADRYKEVEKLMTKTVP